MCDALSRNAPKLSEGVPLLLGYCLAHGRRQFVEVAANFPEHCRYVLETLGGVWYNDELAREQRLTPEERLRFHQEHSAATDERPKRVDGGATGGAQSGAEFRAGES